MSILWIDFETRSCCNLQARGSYNYAKDPSTEVLCMCYAIDDGPVQVWIPSYHRDGSLAWDAFPAAVRESKRQIRAYNAAFERLIFKYVLGLDFPLEQFYCTATQARANCMPGALEDIGRFIGTGMRKNFRGKQLIKALSIPQADGSFNDDPALMKEMVEYCIDDVLVMREASKAMRELTDEELLDYHVNERINDLGVRIDIDLCKAAVQYASDETQDIQARVLEVTQGEILTVRSPKLRKWVKARVGPEALKLMGVYRRDKETGEERKKYSIDKSVRANLITFSEENPDEVPEDVKEVIQCTDDLWASSTAKFQTLADLADTKDCRVRGAFVFAGGSATGRACVAAETYVDTLHGPCRIDELYPGQRVLTHTGRFCKVSEVYYKGVEDMYHIRSATGAWVVCTAEHRLLTSKGWKHVKEFIGDTGPESTRRSYEGVYLATIPNDGRDWSDMRANTPNGERDCEGDSSSGSATYFEGGKLLPVKSGGKKPPVRLPQTGGSDTPERVQVFMESGNKGLRSRAQAYTYEGSRISGVAGELGSASHRQRQDEQHVGQLGDCNESWASIVTLSEVIEIIRVGEKGVWDITVEGDASYCAQGLIHHNSSYGAQVHNFPRKCVDDPEKVRKYLTGNYEIVPEFGKRTTDVLKGMLRPALLPAIGHVFVAADWSSIEGRVNPWLADTPGGERKLNIYREHKDPYIVNAMAMYGCDYDEVTKDQRQVGKVMELALSYMGGKGAFATFSRAFGILFTEHEVQSAIQVWRDENQWCMQAGRKMQKAYMAAIRHPGKEFTTGRITYYFDGLHLWYMLPSGRVLNYPFAKIEEEGISYAKASWKPGQSATEWPRGRLWPGLALENATQATSNDILRYALRELDNFYYRIVLHVHDEIVLEVPESEAEQAVKDMEHYMTKELPAWAAGLPLEAEIKILNRYGK